MANKMENEENTEKTWELRRTMEDLDGTITLEEPTEKNNRNKRKDYILRFL